MPFPATDENDRMLPNRADFITGARTAIALLALAVPFTSPAQSTPTWAIEGALQPVYERNPYWGLAETYAPDADYDDRYSWTEWYLKPSWAWTTDTQEAMTWRAGMSLVASGTIGTDLFQEDYNSRVDIENAYVGVRWQDAAGTSVDLSAGRQPWSLGQLMLLSVGAVNGFERGAALLSPRSAWDMTAALRAQRNAWTGEVFYLDPDELPSADSRNRLAGVRGGWSPDPSLTLGAAWIKVLESDSPYPQAPVIIIEGGREDLRTFDVYGKWAPTEGPAANWSFSGELAWQRNSRIDMRAFGGVLDAGFRFASARFMPRLSYSLRYFSGDDPDTAGRLERFDPLYYDSSPDTWSSGGNGSFAFYNSNLVVHRARLELMLSPTDFFNAYYWHVGVAETDSPVQYGQAARPVITEDGFAVISGFPKRALTQELYLEHTHIFSDHWFITSGVGLARPEEGLEAIIDGGGNSWVGAYVNLTFRY
jgi:hypothetical protein